MNINNMRKTNLLSIALFLCLILTVPSSYSKTNLSNHEKALLSDSNFYRVKISPSGKKIAVVFKKRNKFAVAILNKENLNPVLAYSLSENEKVSQLFWFNNDTVVYKTLFSEGYLKKYSNSEVHLYSLNAKTKRSRHIYPKKNSAEVTQSINLISKKPVDKNYLLFHEEFRTINSHSNRLVKVNVYSGRSNTQKDLGKKHAYFLLDNDNNLRLIVGMPKFGVVEMSYKDNSSNWKSIKSEKVFGSIRFHSMIGFNKENNKLYFIGAKDDTPEKVYSIGVPQKGRPDNISKLGGSTDSDILSYYWDEDKKKLLYIYTGLERPEKNYMSETKEVEILKQLDKAFPGENVELIQTWNSNMLLGINSDKRPYTYYIYDHKNKAVKEFLKSKEAVDLGKTVQTESINYQTRDGKTIYGFLHKPKDKSTPLPLIIDIHGGPFGVNEEWQFNNFAQFFANRGYAYLNINFRGSGGRGKGFKKLGVKAIGSGMQHDIIDAAKWAIEEKITVKDNICLWGISYGGSSSAYSFMMRQDLFKCALTFGGVYDFSRILDSGDVQYSDYGKKFWEKYLHKSDEKRLQNSPIAHVQQITKPIYIMHGKEDLRVPISQARSLKKELEEKGKSFEYKEFSGVGHWFTDEDKKINFFSRALKFFDKHLKKEK